MKSGYTMPKKNNATFGVKHKVKIVHMAATHRAAFLSFEIPEFLLDSCTALLRHSKFCFSLTTRRAVEMRTTKKQMKDRAEKELFNKSDLSSFVTS